MILAHGDVFAQSFKSESEVRKQAEKDVKNEDYTAALSLYSQLLSLNQKDAKLNYRYGVCLLMADKDKTSSYNYLEFASRDAKMEDDVYFYIGKSLQLKYRFDEAINSYKEFIKRAGSSALKKFDTERQIETCNNAKELLKSRINVTVKSSKEVPKNAIYGSYDFATAGGKFLATSEKFMTAVDKHKILIPIMFLSADGQSIFYTSYGKKEDNGKDIYVIHKLASGEWGAPQSLGTTVNTKFDEDYPYLDADGKTLYFSSKGHNSMGGYDIFKTTFDAVAGTWSEPVNLGAGINSPDDDFFYMPVSDGEAQFASTKETPKATVMVYRIEVASAQKVLATIHGKYKSVDQLRADGKISVLRKSDNGLVATARTDQKTGEYELSIPGGYDYEIVVEGGGYMAHVEDFSLPKMDRPVTISQQVNMNRNMGAEELEIRNQYLQSDSASIASSPVPKGTQVIRDEYKVDETNKQDLQPFTIDGQIVYATPPSKNTVTENDQVPFTGGKTIMRADSIAMSNTYGNAATDNKLVNEGEQKAKSKEGIDSPAEEKKSDDVDEKNEEQKESSAGKLLNDEVRRTANNNNSTDKKSNKKDAAGNAKKLSDDKNVISDKELVKNAFSDAKDLDDEAKEIATDAAVAHSTANVKDSVSKAQLNQMAEVLKKGDEGMARELSRQSQLNADTAQQQRTLAGQLDGKAKISQVEANRALADAKELMKNTVKDTSSQVAVNKSSRNKKEGSEGVKKKADKINERQTKENIGDAAKDSREIAAKNDDKSSDSQKEKDSITSNATGEVEVDNDSKLSRKTNDSASAEGDDESTDTVNSKADAVAKEKASASGVGTSGSVNVADNKSVQATNKSATSEEATARAEELKSESKDFKLQSDALKEQANKSADKDEKNDLMKQSKDFAVKSKKTDKEAVKEYAVAKELKKKEEKSPQQAKEVAKTSAEKKKEAEQRIAEKPVELKADAKKENAMAVDNNLASEEERVANSKNTNSSREQKSNAESVNTGAVNANEKTESTTTPGRNATDNDIKVGVEPSREGSSDKEKGSNPPVAKTEETKQSAPAPAYIEDATSSQVLKDVPIEVVNSYKEYLKTKQQSDAQAKEANDLQTKVEKMPPSAQRDQLIQQSNDLNLQSIKTWQEAQVKLNEVKEIDPSAEPKLKQAFAQQSFKEKTTASANEVNSSHQPKDSLMFQAVTHREMAENATDTATEKSELKKTEQLIVESSNSEKVKSTKQLAANNQGDKQQGSASSSDNANEYSKNQANVTSGIARSKTPSDNESKMVTTSSKRASQKTSLNNKSSQKEVANKTTTNEVISSEDAPESSSTVNTTTAVLDAKTLHVDEDAVFSVSPKPVYNAANPIPMNPSLPEGLVFKVQIGAFHNPLPVEAFKNVQPLSGETTRPGWIRYCVGMFRTFEPANLVKMNMRSGGYKDAFVVAYYNGKRISLYEAYSIINRSGSKKKELYAVASEKETHHLNSLNIIASDNLANKDEDATSFYGTSITAASTDELAVEYAVQVGVYKTNVVPKKLQPLIPLNAEAYKNDLYRFTTGHFALRSLADSMRLVAVNTGVKDAFVIIYKGSRRAGESYSSIKGNKTNAVVTTAVNSSTLPTTGEVVFKVQIGAYRSDLTEAKLSALKTQCGAELSQSVNTIGLHLIYAGSSKEYDLALLLKNEIVAKGFKDAFVVAFSGNTKIAVPKTSK